MAKTFFLFAAVIVAAALAALWQGARVADLLVGLATGVFAAGLWAYLDHSRRVARQASALQRLEGTYRVRRKGAKDGDVGTVTLTREGTALKTHSEGAGAGSAGAWVGAIAMTGDPPNAGAGTYHHTQKDGWGRHLVQVRGGELLVHAEYSKDGEERVDAYVWTRIAD